MASKATVEFDKVASAKRAAEALFHAEEAFNSCAAFKVNFSQEIASAKRAGVGEWGGARYPGTYGADMYHSLTAFIWPKDANGHVLPNEKIGDDTIKTLTGRRDRLMVCGKICFEEEIALTHLHPKRLKEETQYDIFTGNVKGSDATQSNGEPKTKGAQASKTQKHIGYALATFINHPEILKFLGTVSAELRKTKELNGTTIQKALLEVATKEKLLQSKDGDIKVIKS
jgi:hypothetical protein